MMLSLRYDEEEWKRVTTFIPGKEYNETKMIIEAEFDRNNGLILSEHEIPLPDLFGIPMQNEERVIDLLHRWIVKRLHHYTAFWKPELNNQCLRAGLDPQDAASTRTKVKQ